jgi:hypothetical protein
MYEASSGLNGQKKTWSQKLCWPHLIFVWRWVVSGGFLFYFQQGLLAIVSCWKIVAAGL